MIRRRLSSGDKAIKTIEPEKRNCLFSSEKELELFTAYTYNNCILECFIKNTLNKLNCLPWYLPRFNKTALMACDPWNTIMFMKEMEQMKPERCSHCLSDCDSVKYQVSSTSNTFE